MPSAFKGLIGMDVQVSLTSSNDVLTYIQTIILRIRNVINRLHMWNVSNCNYRTQHRLKTLRSVRSLIFGLKGVNKFF